MLENILYSIVQGIAKSQTQLSEFHFKLHTHTHTHTHTHKHTHMGLSPMAQVVKNMPTMQEIQEMWVLSLGQEDPLKEEMATHSSILP